MAQAARLLDLDGTLVMTQPVYASCLAANGDLTTTAALRSLEAGESVVSIARRIGLGKTAFARAVAAAGVPLVEGWRETLDVLEDRGHPLGVVTSLPGWLAVPLLESCGVFERLAVVVHAGVCRVPKPSPLPIRAAFSLLGREPTRDDLYVGDSAADEGAAAGAGIQFAWASWGYGQPEGKGLTLARPEDLLAL